LPKLKTLLLLGVPEVLTKKWEDVLEKLFDLKALGVTVLDQRGRSLAEMMPGNAYSPLGSSSSSHLRLPIPSPSRVPSAADPAWTGCLVEFDEACEFMFPLGCGVLQLVEF